ncbi:MAG TPA: Crp/Fnr family transcriptional regulator [Rubrivivax sp.]|nr:Crp/Fnr family transcriptional regulator [Burkholderiales bacterium]HNT38504.1 Crp/Fnr family transcriptional regulator [Rubrivivax sp.]
MVTPAFPSARQAATVRASRSRAILPEELRAIPWLGRLDAQERQRVVDDLRVVQVEPGELVCRVGRPVTYWFGVIDGLLKMSNDTALGMPITFTGLPPGGWFGEGTVLKREAYRYNIQALRSSLVTGITGDTFHWLLDRSIGFNRYVMMQLNERLGQFIAAREIDRMTSANARVARSLGSLFHPVLYPGVGGLLRITQQELGYLVGMSRQRVNEALQALQAARLIRIEYGGLRVLDLDGLRRYLDPGPAARAAQARSAPRAASSVASISASPCAAPTKPAS